MSLKEHKFEELQRELLKHKYLYYELGEPEISDREYDKLEKKSFNIAKELGFSADKYADKPEENEQSHIHWMVGFDYEHPYSQEIIKELSNEN